VAKSLINRKVVLAALALFGVYTLAYWAFTPLYLIEVLSSLFMGTLAAGAVVYGTLLFDAFTSKEPLNHVRQMTLGIMCGWLSKALVVVYVSRELREDYATGAIVALALLSGVLQTTAANLGDDGLRVKDARILHIALGFGLAVAAATIIIQFRA
jgi:hypothetical protein